MKKKGQIDWLLFIPVLALMLFSIAFVYSASANISALKFGSPEGLFLRHTIRIIAGIFIIILFSKIDYRKLRVVSKPLIIISIGLLVVVLFTPPVNNVNRWLSMGPINFQPSELAKFAVVLHFAHLIDKKQEKIKDLKEGFVPLLLWLGGICFLIAMQPNFSTTIVIYLIGLSILFIGNTHILHVVTTGLLSVLAGVVYLTSTSSYRLDRIIAYFGNPATIDAGTNINYQLNQSLIALGNGGIFGVGPGQSAQADLFLPESYGDFIFAIIGEEYGFIGTTIILCVFLLIFWRGLVAAKNAPDRFGYYLASGIVLTFAFYVFVNAGVNSGLLPTTGLPMPFVSYGGTAVLFYSAAIGILLNISSFSGLEKTVED